MPIDSQIPLQARVPDLGNKLLQFVQLKQAREDRDLQNKLVNRQLEKTDLEIGEFKEGAPLRKAKAAGEGELELEKSLIHASLRLKPYFDAGDIEGAKAEALDRRASLEKVGLPTEHTDRFIKLLESDPILAKKIVDDGIIRGQQLGLLKGPEKQGGFTLGKEQVRYDASGKEIARGPKGDSAEDKLFGGGVTGRSLQYLTQMAPAYAEGKLDPNQERVFESAYTQYTQPIQYQNPDTGILETRRPEVPKFVQEAFNRRKGTEQPEPQSDQAKQPAQSDESVWGMSENISGPVPAIGETVSRTPLVGGLLPAPEFTKARNFVQNTQRDLVRVLQNNPRYAEGERQAIEKEISIEAKIFDNPTAFKNRLKALNKSLEVRQRNAYETANSPRVGKEERIQAMNILNGIQQFRMTLGVPPEVKTDEDYDAIPSGTRFLDPKGMERIKP